MLLGFWGAIHGANKANTTNTTTRTIPADANMLRRPRVAAVFHVVEIAMSSKVKPASGLIIELLFVALPSSAHGRTDRFAPAFQCSRARHWGCPMALASAQSHLQPASDW